MHTLIGAILEKQPRDYGLPGKQWTVPLIARYLTGRHAIVLPVKTIRAALQEMDYARNGSRYASARNARHAKSG